MRRKLWSNSITSFRYRTKPYKLKHPREHPFFDRQELIPGFDQLALQNAQVVLRAYPNNPAARKAMRAQAK